MGNETNEQGTIRYVRCNSCGTPNPGTARFCSRCGKPVAEAAPPPPLPQAAQQVTCPTCHKPLPLGSKFCGYCGSSLVAAQSISPPIMPPKAPEQRPAVVAQPTPAAFPPRLEVPPVVSAAPRTEAAPPSPAFAPPPPKPFAPAPSPVAARPPSPPAPVAPQASPFAASMSGPPLAAPAPPKLPTDLGTGVSGGTVVFAGLRAPKIEATVVEVKPDGSTGRNMRITKETSIGSGSTDLSYPRDTLLAPSHASIAIREAKVVLRDFGSPNGTFVKQRQEGQISPGDIFLLGKTLFRFTSQGQDLPSASTGTVVLSGPPIFQKGPSGSKLEQIQLNGDVVKEFSLDKPEVTIGRVSGDLVFGSDPYMSSSHARIVAQHGGFLLQDLKSRNGIYRRIRGEMELTDGDEFFAGEQLFRVEVKSL